MKTWKEIIKKDPRYSEFTLLDKPTPFNKLFENKDLYIVQLHSIKEIGESIIGFVGEFNWENNKITPLDGDSYSQEMPVYGYMYFKYKNRKCLDILIRVW